VRIHRINAKQQKLCAVPRCSIVISRRFLMCLAHWSSVPKGLRLQIWAALTAWTNDPSNGAKLNKLNALQAEAIGLVS
jgi:hypothetical protein